MRIDQLQQALADLAEGLAPGEEQFEPILGQNSQSTGSLLYVYRTRDNQRTIHAHGPDEEACRGARDRLLKWVAPGPEVLHAS